MINEFKWNISKLWEGCILSSIAHSIMVAHYPELSNEHSWDRINYNIQNSEDTRGTITFTNNYCIAAFRYEKSPRINKNDFFYERYFKDAPIEILEFAKNETLQYLLENYDSQVIPIITTAFWGYENRLNSNDTVEEFIENGGFLIERELLETRESMNRLIIYYDMTEKQVSLLKSLFEKKINNKDKKIYLSKDDIKLIGTDDYDGLTESRISFEEIDVEWIE